jgi:hypothetical protein
VIDAQPLETTLPGLSASHTPAAPADAPASAGAPAGAPAGATSNAHADAHADAPADAGGPAGATANAHAGAPADAHASVSAGSRVEGLLMGSAADPGLAHDALLAAELAGGDAEMVPALRRVRRAAYASMPLQRWAC